MDEKLRSKGNEGSQLPNKNLVLKTKHTMTFSFYDDEQNTVRVDGIPLSLDKALALHNMGLVAIVKLFVEKGKGRLLDKNNIITQEDQPAKVKKVFKPKLVEV